MNDELNLAWAAGLFDGEGCISIGYNKATARWGARRVSPGYRLTVKLTMGSRATVERFGQFVGGNGTTQLHQSTNAKVNSSYSWCAMSRKGYDLLKLLRPHLFLKAAEADIAIAFFELPMCSANGVVVADKSILQKKHDLYIKCAQLKSRWRFRKSFPSKTPDFAIV